MTWDGTRFGSVLFYGLRGCRGTPGWMEQPPHAAGRNKLATE